MKRERKRRRRTGSCEQKKHYLSLSLWERKGLKRREEISLHNYPPAATGRGLRALANNGSWRRPGARTLTRWMSGRRRHRHEVDRWVRGQVRHRWRSSSCGGISSGQLFASEFGKIMHILYKFGGEKIIREILN